jgi:hypothetical protein
MGTLWWSFPFFQDFPRSLDSERIDPDFFAEMVLVVLVEIGASLSD